MTIIQFENQGPKPLVLTIEPRGDKHEIPHLAIAGIRFTPKDGLETRHDCSVSAYGLSLWCDAESYEIDFVHPTAYQRLMWDLCVGRGWCGSTVNGEPLHVDDLLPGSGVITAEAFAKLVLQADDCSMDWPPAARFLRQIEARFVEHMGSASIDVRALAYNLARPFEREAATDEPVL
ncbi:MAG: hypothetical protein QM608_15475 [Caulobacter sp.]